MCLGYQIDGIPCRLHGYAQTFEQCTRLVFRPGEPNPVAKQEKRSLRLLEPFDNGENRSRIRSRVGILPQFRLIESDKFGCVDFCRLNIQRDVEPNRAWTARTCKIHCLFEFVSNASLVVNISSIFCDWLYHIDDVEFLQSTLAQSVTAQRK